MKTMKKLLPCLLACAAASLLHVQGQETAVQLPVRFGGNVISPSSADGRTSAFSSLVSSLGIMEEPEYFDINPAIASMASIPRHTVRLKLATWTGSEMLAIGINWDPNGGSTQSNKGGVYLSYEPVSNQARSIGSYTGDDWWLSFCGIAYDATSQNVYLLSRPTIGGVTGTTGTGQYLLRMTTESIDTTRIGGAGCYISMDDGSPVPSLRAIAIDRAGLLYGIATDSNLYRIDKNTARMVWQADLKLKISDYATQAFFSQNSDVLYIVKSDDGFGEDELWAVDMNTYNATYLADLDNTVYGMFHHYYTGNVPPKGVDGLTAQYDIENRETKLTWQNPSLNYNEEALDNLSDIAIYRRNPDNGQMGLTETIQAGDPGATQSYSIQESTEGIFTYGITARTSEGLSSYYMDTVQSPAYNLQAPYALGFEETDNMMPVSLGNTASITQNKTEDSIRNGNAALKLPAVDDYVSINGLQVEKGRVYRISYWVARQKASSTAQSSLYVDGEEISFQPFSSSQNAYVLAEGTFAAKETKAVDIRIAAAKRYAAFTGPLYVDDINIVQIRDNNTPDSLHLISCTPADSGRLAAEVRFTTPSLQSGGSPLSSLSGIYVDMMDRDEAEPLDTIYTNAIGEEMTVFVPVPEADYYTLRFTPFNEAGPCPFPVTAPETGWIGFDTVPMKPENVALENLPDGTARLTWSQVPSQGKENGFFGGEITGYEITQERTYMNKVYGITTLRTTSASDTSCIMTADSMFYYTYNVTAIRNGQYSGKSTTHYGLNGIKHGDRILQTAFRNTPDYAPFHFNYNYANTALNQTIYLDSLIGGPIFIDSLYFMARQQKDNKRPMKIYLGVTDKTAFESKTDFFDYLAEGTLVFDDSLVTQESNQQILGIPIEPYFYDGTGNLVVTILRPYYELKNQTENFFAAKTLDEKRNIKITSRDADFDTISSMASLIALAEDVPASVTFTNLAPMAIASSIENVACISGMVVRKANQQALAGVSIALAPEAGNKVDFSYSLATDSSGQFRFAYLPAGKYQVTFHLNGFVDSVCSIEIASGQELRLDIALEDGEKIDLNGTVKAQGSQTVLAEVDIHIQGPFLNEHIQTDANGQFSITDLYNTSIYNLRLNRRNYTEALVWLTTPSQGDTSIVITMSPYPFPVTELTAENTDGILTLSWQEPQNEDGMAVEPSQGYHIYRIPDADTSKEWIEAGHAQSGSLQFSDPAFGSLPPSIMKYAVIADYGEGNLSEAIITDSVFKDMLFNVAIQVETNGASAEGAWIRLSQQDISGQHLYEGYADADGRFSIEKFYRGDYYLQAELDFHASVSGTSSIAWCTVLHTPVLIENICVPVIEECSAGPDAGHIHIRWSIAEAESENATVNPIGFKFYADGAAVDSTGKDAREYTFTGLFAGEHIIGVSALFASQESACSYDTVQGVKIENPSASNISLIPNPTIDGKCILYAPEESEVWIYRLNGILKEYFVMKGASQELFLKDNGMYLIRILHQNRTYQIKAVK